MTFDYDSWLKTARDRLESLYQQRAEIEEEISKLERGIQGFAPLVGNEMAGISPPAGIAESIRAIFRERPGQSYSPTAIRDELLVRGLSLAQNNPMATIHQTLARLVEHGYAKTYLHDGKTSYYGVAAQLKQKRRASAKGSSGKIVRRRHQQPSPMEGEKK